MRLSYETDDGARAALGLIVLSVDETVEAEIGRLVPEGAALHHSRIPSAPEVTPGTLAAMEAALPAAAALLPRRTFSAIGYACTSGATVIGPARVADLIRRAHPAAAVVDPLTAAIEGCRALGVSRIGFVTPYVADVSAAMRAALEAAGLKIAAFGSFEQAEEAVVARITERSLLAAALNVGAADEVEAVFASCTNLRSFAIIDEAEARLGKPVLTSNLALGWAMLRRAGMAARGGAPGRLFRRHPAA